MPRDRNDRPTGPKKSSDSLIRHSNPEATRTILDRNPGGSARNTNRSDPRTQGDQPPPSNTDTYSQDPSTANRTTSYAWGQNQPIPRLLETRLQEFGISPAEWEFLRLSRGDFEALYQLCSKPSAGLSLSPQRLLELAAKLFQSEFDEEGESVVERSLMLHHFAKENRDRKKFVAWLVGLAEDAGDFDDGVQATIDHIKKSKDKQTTTQRSETGLSSRLDRAPSSMERVERSFSALSTNETRGQGDRHREETSGRTRDPQMLPREMPIDSAREPSELGQNMTTDSTWDSPRSAHNTRRSSYGSRDFAYTGGPEGSWGRDRDVQRPSGGAQGQLANISSIRVPAGSERERHRQADDSSQNIPTRPRRSRDAPRDPLGVRPVYRPYSLDTSDPQPGSLNPRHTQESTNDIDDDETVKTGKTVSTLPSKVIRPKKGPRSEISSTSMEVAQNEKALKSMKADQRNLLNSDYFLRKGTKAVKFFVKGRVLSILWHENSGHSLNDRRPPGQDHGKPIHAFSSARGEVIYSHIRRFVIVKVCDGFVLAIPIYTYGGQGVAKRGMRRREQQSHAIIYTEGQKPANLAKEPKFIKRPIRVTPVPGEAPLDRASRLHFGRLTTINMNLKVKDCGQVDDEQSLKELQRHVMAQFRADEDIQEVQEEDDEPDDDDDDDDDD